MESGWEFQPEPDITAFELAQVLAAVKLIVGNPIMLGWDLSVSRHFKPVPEKTIDLRKCA